MRDRDDGPKQGDAFVNERMMQTADPLSGTPLHSGAEANYLQPSPPRSIPLSQSQLEAWHKIRGKLQDIHLLILSCLTNMGPSCIRLIADELHIETSTISARMFDLKKLGLIEPHLDVNGKQVRLRYMVRGENSSGSAWQAREDWKEFLNHIQGYPGILL